jgi:hypothetical protein
MIQIYELVRYTPFFLVPKPATIVDYTPSQQNPYISAHKDFKLIACSVQELWCSRVELTNCDAAASVAAAGAVPSSSNSTLVVQGSDIDIYLQGKENHTQ